MIIINGILKTKVKEIMHGNGQFENLVSVIMPCYNDGCYIQASIDSVSAQTWKNVELIVIDDGSDDQETIDVINSLVFPHLKILHTDHSGPAAARNFGIQNARGKYILPLDADDLIEPTYIEKAVSILDGNDNVGIVYCYADLFGMKNGRWDLPDYTLEKELIDNIIFVTAMFRKKHWERVGGFCEDFKFGMEDYDFWLSLIGLGLEVVQIKEVLFHYRIKNTSRSSLFNSNYQAIQNTYKQIYYRNKSLLTRNIDSYCTSLRYQLIDKILINRKLNDYLSHPIILYWQSVIELKPRYAQLFLKWLNFKSWIKINLFSRF